MRRTEKLAATGRLAASIAHEINNPLEAITNLLYLLRRFCKLDESALNYVTIAEQEVHRMSEITQQTLRFYRQSTLPARASMEELLDSVLDMYVARLGTLGVVLERDYDPSDRSILFCGRASAGVFKFCEQCHGCNGGGRAVDGARAALAGLGASAARGGAHHDCGHGQRDDKPRCVTQLFEAFFTTKGATGTGLGLWVSHEIILKHHGIIGLRSRAAGTGNSSGTVFHMFFPDNEDLTGGAEPRERAAAGRKASRFKDSTGGYWSRFRY